MLPCKLVTPWHQENILLPSPQRLLIPSCRFDVHPYAQRGIYLSPFILFLIQLGYTRKQNSGVSYSSKPICHHRENWSLSLSGLTLCYFILKVRFSDITGKNLATFSWLNELQSWDLEGRTQYLWSNPHTLQPPGSLALLLRILKIYWRIFWEFRRV